MTIIDLLTILQLHPPNATIVQEVWQSKHLKWNACGLILNWCEDPHRRLRKHFWGQVARTADFEAPFKNKEEF